MLLDVFFVLKFRAQQPSFIVYLP